MKNNILEIKIGNTTFTVEAKNAEISKAGDLTT